MSPPDRSERLVGLAEILFASEEPSPKQLREAQGMMGRDVRFVSLFLNLRLIVRWAGFGVHDEMIAPVAEQPYTYDLRLYDPDEYLVILRRSLEAAGFRDLEFRRSYAGLGGWIRVVATDELVQRLQGSAP